MSLKSDLNALANPSKAKLLQGFFKTGKGEYGEGDKFLGVSVPDTRKIAKKYMHLPLQEISPILDSKIHEERLCALLVLVEKFRKASEEERKKIYEFYWKHSKKVNNWDLVDLSAHKIVGEYLQDKDKNVLLDLVKSENLWQKRIAVVSTFSFISRNDFKYSLKIAKILLEDKNDLIHKAVGWMLREIGKKDKKVLVKFLEENAAVMPRTMLRYAIEKFSEKERKKFLRL